MSYKINAALHAVECLRETIYKNLPEEVRCEIGRRGYLNSIKHALADYQKDVPTDSDVTEALNRAGVTLADMLVNPLADADSVKGIIGDLDALKRYVAEQNREREKLRYDKEKKAHEETKRERNRLAKILHDTTYDILADYDAEITALIAIWAKQGE